MKNLSISGSLNPPPLNGWRSTTGHRPFSLARCLPTRTPGWAGAEQYPRISYTIDMRANPERQTAGNLYLDVWCLDSGTAPEAVEPSVRAALCDVIVAPHEQPPYSLAWVTSETFEATKQLDKSARVIGVTVTFDLYALPQQETTDPDPIMAMNAFTNRWSDAVTVIGSDRMGEYTEPSDERRRLISALQTTTWHRKRTLWRGWKASWWAT